MLNPRAPASEPVDGDSLEERVLERLGRHEPVPVLEGQETSHQGQRKLRHKVAGQGLAPAGRH